MTAVRAGHNEDHFDLLPFIAIMMCILGVLLLVTISVAALSMGAGAGEGWVPSNGSGTMAKQPILIEWDGAHLVFHWGEKRERVAWGISKTIGGRSIVVAGDTPNPAFDAHLDALVAMRDAHYALFAVRPAGFESFPRLKAVFKRRGVEIGYEPIDSGKPVKLLPHPGDA
jgi:hypothetical protein